MGYYEKILREKLSVRQTEELVKSLKIEVTGLMRQKNTYLNTLKIAYQRSIHILVIILTLQ